MSRKLPFFLAMITVLFAVGRTLVTPQAEARRLSVLFFGAPTAHSPAHNPITRYRAIKKHLGAEGIDFTYTEDPKEAFNAQTLSQHDAVLMYGNWEQQGNMPADQEKNLLDFVNNGGGFLPIHCASACYGKSDIFINLVGGRFKSHGAEIFSPTTVNETHPITKNLKTFKAWDETYVHDRHTDDRTILQKRDNEPWTWTRKQGQGRVFYTASGHDHRVWDQPNFHELLKRAIYWSVGSEKYSLLKNLDLPELEEEAMSLPGYRERKEITKGQKPLTPAESMKLAQVPPGIRALPLRCRARHRQSDLRKLGSSRTRLCHRNHRLPE